MKYLDIPELSSLTSFLTSLELGDRHLRAKVEAYSCKQGGMDKKLGKQLEQNYVREIEQTPSGAYGTSPLGTFTQPQTRRLLINLICTLNASFPDYDFSTLKPEQFLKETIGMVVNHVNMTFAEIVETHSKVFLEDLWGSIDRVVSLKNCQVFSYIPDMDNDPFSTPSNLWSFNYFFYNKAEKKLVFFTCACTKSNRIEDAGLGEDDSFSTSEFKADADSDEEWDMDYDAKESDPEDDTTTRGVF